MIVLSCDKLPLIIQCKDCTESEPDAAILNAKLEDPSDGSYDTEINIYEGNIEDSILVSSYKWSMGTWSMEVSLNKKYTVSATYQYKGIRYIAVDCATPRVKFDTRQCEKPCYYVYNNNLDLRIKYY